MEAPRPRNARVERKGRFTITEISPNSPVADNNQSPMSPSPSLAFQDAPPASADTGVATVMPLTAAGVVDEKMLTAVAPSHALAEALGIGKIALPQQQEQHQQPLPMDIDEVSPLAMPTVVPVALSPSQQQQQLESPLEHGLEPTATTSAVGDKAPCEANPSAQPDSAPAAFLTVVVSAVVEEPEPSPVSAAPLLELAAHQQQQQQQRRASLVPDDSFASVDYAVAVAATASHVQSPVATECTTSQLQQLISAAPADSGLTITVNSEPADVAAAATAAARGAALDSNDDDDTTSAPSTPSPTLMRRENKRIESHRAVDRRGKRKSRFTITELTPEPSRNHANELFAQNDSATSPELSPTHNAQSPPPQLLFPSSTSIDSVDDVAAFTAAAASVSQDFSVRSTSSVDYHLYQSQVQRPSSSAMPAPQQRSATRAARVTPQKQRSRESRRMRMRSTSPIRSALQMSDLAADSGADSYAEEQSHSSHSRAAGAVSRHGRSSVFFGGSSIGSGGGGGSLKPAAFAHGASALRRQSVDESDGYSSSARRHVSSRQKSITISASQFLQQQQTIAALIRQQQELKHVIGVLQEQQQQLMSVPVQLHELRLENAKDDGKDEMMRELYVQVDSLMRANDSLQVLLTQAEKEAQDRAQEAEFLTEENDQLLARCDYFERKFIEERKVTFILEEEVQRFRMISLTQELEQRSSVGQHDLSS